jgi:predicted nuclease of predicted toxin-antitoxin system
MKLLFDQNLSPKLAEYFNSSFAGSQHLQSQNLDKSSDTSVWEFAKSNEFTIVTKDNDFNNLVAFWGFPPKVIWIRRGNCSTSDIKELLSSNINKIKAFILDSTNGILTLI